MNSISNFFLSQFLQTEKIPNESPVNEKTPISEVNSSPAAFTSRPDQGLAELSRGKKLLAIAATSGGNVTLSKSLINFGEVDAGKTKSESFYINNNSDCNILVRFSPSNSSFSTSVNYIRIPAHSSNLVQVYFKPSSFQSVEKQRYLGYMNIFDRSGNSLGSISLSGTSVEKKK